MESFVFVAVLFAAACHAAWNALIKVGLDPLSTTTLIAIGAAVVSFVCLPLAGVPAPPAWPWLIASAIIHLLYFATLIESYRTGDLGQVYPIARGSAPLMTAIISAAFIGEHLSLLGWSGIVTLAAGVLLLSARGGRGIVQLDRRAVGYALLTYNFDLEYGGVEGMLTDLYVEKRYRNHGIGSLALYEIEDFCRDRGISSVELQVVARNKAAETFYRKSGFRVLPRKVMVLKVRPAEKRPPRPAGAAQLNGGKRR